LLALGRDAYSLERVVLEERAVFEAAAMLVERRREVALRAPDAGLDPQQQAAYAQLGAERISRSSRALRVPASRVCSATSRRRTTRPGFA